MIKNIKNILCGNILLMILTEKKLLEFFTNNNCKKNRKESRIKKVMKRKEDKL